jgi:hypothetical protein
MLHNPPDARQVLPQLLWDVMPEQQDDKRFSYQQAPSYTHVGSDGLSSMAGLSEAYNLVLFGRDGARLEKIGEIGMFHSENKTTRRMEVRNGLLGFNKFFTRSRAQVDL